jgi:concanavalin A-like lectin/glucanase superfamily protein
VSPSSSASSSQSPSASTSPSSSVSQSLSPSSSASPSPPPDLALDLQADNSTLALLADGSVFFTWPDESGNANDATAPASGNRPVYKTSAGPGGKPCVRFNAVAFLNLVSAISGAVTIFVIMKPNSGADRTMVGSTTGGRQYRVESSLKQALYTGASYSLAGTSTTAVSTSSFQQVCVTSSSAPAGDFRLGRAADGSYSASISSTQGLFHIGTDGPGLNRFSGDICCVRVYSRVLTSTEIAAVEAELLTRWGV